MGREGHSTVAAPVRSFLLRLRRRRVQWRLAPAPRRRLPPRAPRRPVSQLPLCLAASAGAEAGVGCAPALILLQLRRWGRGAGALEHDPCLADRSSTSPLEIGPCPFVPHPRIRHVVARMGWSVRHSDVSNAHVCFADPPRRLLRVSLSLKSVDEARDPGARRPVMISTLIACLGSPCSSRARVGGKDDQSCGALHTPPAALPPLPPAFVRVQRRVVAVYVRYPSSPRRSGQREKARQTSIKLFSTSSSLSRMAVSYISGGLAATGATIARRTGTGFCPKHGRQPSNGLPWLLFRHGVVDVLSSARWN